MHCSWTLDFGTAFHTEITDPIQIVKLYFMVPFNEYKTITDGLFVFEKCVDLGRLINGALFLIR